MTDKERGELAAQIRHSQALAAKKYAAAAENIANGKLDSVESDRWYARIYARDARDGLLLLLGVKRWHVACREYQASAYDYEGWAHPREWKIYYDSEEEALLRAPRSYSGLDVSEPRFGL